MKKVIKIILAVFIAAVIVAILLFNFTEVEYEKETVMSNITEKVIKKEIIYNGNESETQVELIINLLGSTNPKIKNIYVLNETAYVMIDKGTEPYTFASAILQERVIFNEKAKDIKLVMMETAIFGIPYNVSIE